MSELAAKVVIFLAKGEASEAELVRRLGHKSV